MGSGHTTILPRSGCFRAQADLNPALIAKAVAQRIDKLRLLDGRDPALRERIAARLAVIEARRAIAQGAWQEQR